MHRQRMDVTVVGAGMVGMAQAALLAVRQPQLQIALLEAAAGLPQVSPQDYDPRVVALTQASQELLDEVGVWSAIAGGRVCPYSEMRVWDAEGTGSVRFSSRDVNLPNLGHIVENNVVVAEGSVRSARKGGGFLNAVFCDVFEMEASKIKRLTTYLAEL